MRPWANLTSNERLDAVLLAVAELNEESSDATGNAIAYHVEARHPMAQPRHGNHGTGNVARAMSMATRVTPAITALRKRGLLTFWRRTDGLSGTADWLTEDGKKRVAELRAGHSADNGVTVRGTRAEEVADA